MVCFKERYPLLLECFISFHRCMRRFGRTADNIYNPLIVNIMLFLPKTKLQISRKFTYFGHYNSTRNEIVCYEERHPLLLKYLITFIRCIRMIGGAFESMYHLPHHCHHVISAKLYTQKYQANSLILVTPTTNGNGMMCLK